MKKILVLVRHGETVFNQRKKIQGWTDSPLTDLGIRQAEYSARWIQENGFHFDHAYSSTSERACDTLELITDLPYSRLKGLKEWNFGTLDGEAEYLNPPLEDYSEFFRTHGGESRPEVIERMNRTLLEIMNRDDHQCVLAVSHGGAMRNFERFWCPDDQDKIPGHLHNAAVLVFEFDPEKQTFQFTDIFNPNYQG